MRDHPANMRKPGGASWSVFLPGLLNFLIGKRLGKTNWHTPMAMHSKSMWYVPVPAWALVAWMVPFVATYNSLLTISGRKFTNKVIFASRRSHILNCRKETHVNARLKAPNWLTFAHLSMYRAQWSTRRFSYRNIYYYYRSAFRNQNLKTLLSYKCF